MKKSIRFLVITSCFLASLVTTKVNAQSGCLPGWQYYTPVTVSNSNASALADFQVNLTINTQALIGAGKMNVDGSDLRFIDGCCNTLCYYIESGINTATTSVWVNVPNVPASGSAIVYMAYGNTGAVAASDGSCTFDLFEDFDSGTQTSFTSICGTINESFAAGVNTASWSSSGIMLSNATFPAAETFTVESDVTAATGTWPAFYWYDAPTQKSYGLMINATQARISVTGGGTDWCSGHNWASTLMTYSGVSGIWSHTWVATGDIRSDFPTVGAITSTDVTHPLTGDKRLGYGGISSGSGSISMNWIRVRKWAANAPTYFEGSETPMSSFSASLVNIPYTDTAFCAGSNVTLDAGAGFASYTWSTTANTQTIDVSAIGQYYVDVVDSLGCASSDTVNITELSLPVVDLGPDMTACQGDTITLDAGTGFTSYSWSSSAGTGQTEEVYTTDDYIAFVTDTTGCTGTDTINVLFYGLPTPSFTSSSTNLDATFTDASTGATGYLWDFGDGSGTSTLANPTYTYATTGTYTVCLTVTSPDLCEDTYCEDIVINNVGIDALNDDFFNVYPTPATEVLTVQSTSTEDYTFEIITLSGKIVANGAVETGKNQISVEEIEAGVYILRIAKEDAAFTQRIVIK